MTAEETATGQRGIDTLKVGLEGRQYDIVVGERLLKSTGWRLRPILPSPRTVTVTDTNVAAHHLGVFEASLQDANIRNSTIVLPAGEGTKSFQHLELLIDRLLEDGVERTTTLIALGGGVVGDITGFAASIVLRGVSFVQIPTTLLAQVDSSVGGKTGINTSRGKNLVGTFHQPLMVIIDIETLDTLSRRQLLAGYAEVLKYGVIDDREFFDWLSVHGADVRDGGRQARRHAILTCCRSKAATVAEDEKEAGRRTLLNLGHTFGHVVEAQTGFGERVLHGEGVSIGMVMAMELSSRLGYCAASEVKLVRHHLSARGLPVDLAGLVDETWTVDHLMDHMFRDKKVRGGKLTFVLLGGIGQAFVTRDVPEDAVRQLLGDELSSAMAAKDG